MNFSEFAQDRLLDLLSAVTRFTEGLLQNYFDDLFGTGDSLDDLSRREILHPNSLIYEAIAQGSAAHSHADTSRVGNQGHRLASLHRLGGHEQLIGQKGAAGDGPAGGQSYRNCGIVQKTQRQFGHIVFLDLEVGGLQHAARHDGVRCHRDRGRADDSDRHVDVPGFRILADQLNRHSIPHMHRRREHRSHLPLTLLKLHVRLDGTDQKALPGVQRRKLRRRLGFGQSFELL